MSSVTLTGKVVDLVNSEIFPGRVVIHDGRIAAIEKIEQAEGQYILPGFIDAHIHIESSMLVPSEFARLAVMHGTVATISDPHEVANVLGIDGVRYMIANGKQVPFHFYFGASPCVPATEFETAGASLSTKDIRALLEEDGLVYVSEMMNYPGVLNRDPMILEIIAIAQELDRPIDGHAPGLRGEQAQRYAEAGISTDHESFTLEEALDKLATGMKILIREGSAAKNFEALHPLFKKHPDRLMFCSDDRHPDDLAAGHMNDIVRRAVGLGYDVMDVLRAACLHPIEHYGLDVGRLQPGDSADCIVVNDLEEFDVKQTYIQGQLVASEGRSLITPVKIETVNRFDCVSKDEADFSVKAGGEIIRVIEAIPGELITRSLELPARIEEGLYAADPDRDLLKLTVVNRYENAPPAVAFIKGIGLKRGALATSVAHDSHNIVAVGVDDRSVCTAINTVIEAKGGACVVDGADVSLLPLPVAGLMSDRSGTEVAGDYARLKEKARRLGSSLPDPFMTLSFMALLVIPSLKLSDKGLFDGERFAFVSLAL